MNDTINSAIDIGLKLACLLTQEQRIKHNETFPEDVRKNPRLEFTTVNREMSRLIGSGGETIKALRAMIRAIEPELEVILLDADDSCQREGEHIHCAMLDLITEYAEACETFFHEPLVLPADGGFRITTSREVPPPIRAACERIFFAIGRAVRERCGLTWEVQ